MDNKKVQIMIVISLFICLILILFVGYSVKKNNFMPTNSNQKSTSYTEINSDNISSEEEIKDDNKNMYYIDVRYEELPNVSYQLIMDDNNLFKLHTEKLNNEFDIEKTIKDYEVSLNDDEFNKVKMVLEYLSNKNELNDKDEYIIFYNEENSNIPLEDKNYILEVLEAVEYIALNEEIVNEKSGRLLGNEVLDNLIIKLNLQEENPAN